MPQDGTVAIVAIAVSGAVSLIAAVVAPITAHRRQARALEAESDRQGRQLAHDRSLRDLEDARTRLDEVIDMGEAALSAIRQAHAEFNAKHQSAWTNQMLEARQCLGQFAYKERRIRVRLGDDDELISRLAEYRAAVESLYALTHGYLNQGDAVPVDEWTGSMNHIDMAHAAVIQIAEQRLGARIHPQ